MTIFYGFGGLLALGMILWGIWPSPDRTARGTRGAKDTPRESGLIPLAAFNFMGHLLR